MKRRVELYLTDEEYEWWLERARAREAEMGQQVPDVPSRAVGIQMYLEARVAVRGHPTLPSHERAVVVEAEGGARR